jgi:hypothetical protein
MKSSICVGSSIALPSVQADQPREMPKGIFSSVKSVSALMLPGLQSVAIGALAASFGFSSQSISLVLLMLGHRLREALNRHGGFVSGALTGQLPGRR